MASSDRKEQRRDEIVAAARAAFCENSYEQTSMASIAARVDIAEATVYKYFDSKWDLLLSVLEQWYQTMFRDYAQDLAGVSGAKARLRLLIWRHLRTLRDNAALCRLMFQQARANPDYRGSTPQKLNRQYTELLVDVLNEGVASGEFRADLPTALLRDMIYGGIEHHAWLYLNGQGELEIDTIADQISQLLDSGIALVGESSNDLSEKIGRETQRLSQIVSQFEQSLSSRVTAPSQ